MLMFIGVFIAYLLLACLLGSLVYVAGTHLLLSYDRKLAQGEEVSPADGPHYTPSKGWRYLGKVALEVGATFLFILLFPLGILSRTPWASRKIHRRPILLVHGLSHNQSAWIFLRLRLKWAGFGPIYSFNLSHTSRPIEALAQEVDRIAKEIEEETKTRDLVLIGHSMGGLIATYYNEEIAPFGKVSHLITIGTPFSGTRLACINPRLSARQMRPSSELLTDIKNKLYANTYTRYCQIATTFDNIIYPYQSALLEGKAQLLLDKPGHLGLLFTPAVASKITYWLKEAVPPGSPKGRRAKQPKKRLAPHS